MKDDTPQSSSGTTSQKSVTDWLMQVISGKAPMELHLDATPERPPTETASRRQQQEPEAATAVAVEDMPHIELPPTEYKNGTVTTRIEFTAEDLCGAPVFHVTEPQIEASQPQIEEVTADDVCWVPVERRLKPQSPPVPDIFKAPDEIAEHRPYVPELPERMITSADISREMPPYAAVNGRNGFSDLLHNHEPEVEEAEPEKAVAIEDISRIPVALPSEPPVTVEDIFRELPSEGAAAEEVEPHAAAAEEVHEAATTEHEPVIEAADVTAGAAIAGEIVSVGSTGATANTPEAALPESIFAHEGIWADPRRETVAAPGEVVSEQAYREREKGFPSQDDLREMEKIRPEGWNSAVKTLMRLGSVLPWLARVIPMLESGAGLEQNANLVQEVQHEVAGLRMVQYEIRTTIQEHSVQLKRMEEQLSRVRESSGVTYNEGLAETVQSTAKLVRWVGIGLGGLVLILIVMVAVLIAHGR